MSASVIREELVQLFSKYIEKPAYADYDEDSLIDMIGETITKDDYKRIMAWRKQDNPLKHFEELLDAYATACTPEKGKAAPTNSDIQNEYACTKLGIEYSKVAAKYAFGKFLTKKTGDMYKAKEFRSTYAEPEAFFKEILKLAGNQDKLKVSIETAMETAKANGKEAAAKAAEKRKLAKAAAK